MPKRIKNRRSSRRVPPPKDSDFDHEIGLVDHSASGADSQTEDGDSIRPSSRPPNSAAGPSRQDQPAEVNNGTAEVHRDTHANDVNGSYAALAHPGQPSVQVELPTPDVEINQPKSPERMTVKPRPETPETAIDILYENQRGGFLCGVALFSSKALGNLDPSPWTNSVHKTSPTNITNAQVPDPSWEWVWPEWRINHGDGVDDDGWEYSFMFSKKFSWHKPAWWNSFVRRRAWIRKRAKKANKPLPQDASSMRFNPEYFSVRPSSELERPSSRLTLTSQQHQRAPSRGSHRNSRVSISTAGDEIILEEIDTIDGLVAALRRSRIDREKIEAVDNYLKHSTEDELEGLQDVMHDVMAMFVFQASRRALLTRLTEVYDQTIEKQERLARKPDNHSSIDGDAEQRREIELASTKKRAENLASAIKHADEEVRRLEFWSDVKGMAEKGESKGAVDQEQGWDPSWQGVDNSGPAEPPPPEGLENSADKK
ncbi:putative PEX23-like peroxisomal biogenesis factor 23-like [Naviculisporaceae sp. PSN 640]